MARIPRIWTFGATYLARIWHVFHVFGVTYSAILIHVFSGCLDWRGYARAFAGAGGSKTISLTHSLAAAAQPAWC